MIDRICSYMDVTKEDVPKYEDFSEDEKITKKAYLIGRPRVSSGLSV